MCGIFGGVGKSVNPAIIRGLAYANLSRGKDSTGFFDGRGRIIKAAKASPLFLSMDETGDWLDEAAATGIVGGHTRQASRGAVSDENAHPFHYGQIVGTHNGHVQAPTEYAVDSMMLFDNLNKENGDYQKALKDVDGYFAIAWMDTADPGGVKLLCHNHTVHYGKLRDTFYWSSEKEPLLAVGCKEITAVTSGDVVRLGVTGEKVTLTKFTGFVRPPQIGYSGSYSSGNYYQSPKWVDVSLKPDTYFVLRFVPWTAVKEGAKV